LPPAIIGTIVLLSYGIKVVLKADRIGEYIVRTEARTFGTVPVEAERNSKKTRGGRKLQKKPTLAGSVFLLC